MILTSKYLQGANDARRADLMTEAVGQGVSFVREALPVADIVDDLAGQARRTLSSLVG